MSPLVSVVRRQMMGLMVAPPMVAEAAVADLTAAAAVVAAVVVAAMAAVVGMPPATMVEVAPGEACPDMKTRPLDGIVHLRDSRRGGVPSCWPCR